MTPEELKQLEANLWQSADTLRANSDLKSSEYSTPVMGLIFLKFADNKYRQYAAEIQQEYEALKGTRREKAIAEIAIEKCGFYLPDHARYNYLLNLPEEEDIAKAIKAAMVSIESYKPELKDTLPQDEYFRLTRTDKGIPKQLLKNFSNIPENATGDMFGQIYEYFLGNFALSEGQGGGEFFTPRSVVRLMVEIIEPHQGTVFDPACGSGGMFVQSAQFIEEQRKKLNQSAADDLFVYGQEKTLETVKLAKMNIAVNGLRGDVRQTNTYYEDPFGSFGKFDYVLANPPFNVDDVNLSRVEIDARFNTYGIPRNKTKGKKQEQGNETVPNANYLWINLFATSLKPKGRAALVMANSASDARHSEADIRQKLIEENLIYGMLTLPSNMFYTVTLPATLWFFDRGKTDDKILFIDARNIFTQVDRSHREFSTEQISNIAIISHLRRGRSHRFIELINNYFQQGMVKLRENQAQVQQVSQQLITVLNDGMDDIKAREAAVDFLNLWDDLPDLEIQYQGYLDKYNFPEINIEIQNQAQQELSAAFKPFFDDIHLGLKQLDKTIRAHETALAEKAKEEGKRGQIDKQVKTLKATLETLHTDVKSAESFFIHIRWLQERFPKAEYEDVTGLCKLATPADVKEQDYSLNPGRYVGVVIEEDGKTEEEFIEEILGWNTELEKLNQEAIKLGDVIRHNIQQLVGE
ncbi:N-6 DNA methylase [Trichormus variabilis ATCC 29413]|uniref:site-specific DNA-methyltransferase (adenine-specific) n=3 Tax=Anabaena variabilis TaxID=264691 RepID=Q3M7D1_TRIV2|nr:MULTISPECIES: class I SAM-dependent DNA methyltransferase [Nostocaceae]ABA23105.1 N-6 DNA methylase [Trichormus variabilis ATCC 29413]MBC1214090.1 SAM-dependent DNA methyltransferase [Trichormus variabilis ARAD]MBC1270199.1 SAM-dependent DNA methyltransferase [Trichormus variabilis FSR]MBC1303351.1 SAM-dependent DNA methyltransferase [Trichormus variabilis N2B]MBC1309848.1 SAM-dependent DNA methyltransferase [Trichormus variabilis PNB]